MGGFEPPAVSMAVFGESLADFSEGEDDPAPSAVAVALSDGGLAEAVACSDNGDLAELGGECVVAFPPLFPASEDAIED